jgi:DNA polymerase-3 subunit epsilon
MRGRVFAAHNAAFVRRFLVEEFARAGWAVPLGTRNTVCMLNAAHAAWPGAPRRLGALCAERGVARPAVRSARGDAVATAEILRHLLDVALASPRVQSLGRLPWAAQLEAAAVVAWPTEASAATVSDRLGFPDDEPGLVAAGAAP